MPILPQMEASLVKPPAGRYGPPSTMTADPLLFLLDGKTILVEKRLQVDPKLIGRMKFTIAHELAHQFISHNLRLIRRL